MAASQAVRHELLLPLNGQTRRRGYISSQRRIRQRMHLSKMSSRERAGYQSVTASAKPDQEAPSSSTSSLSRLEGTDLQPGPGPQQQAPGGWTILGLEPSAELAAISIVYFVQGILGLARLAVTYLFKDEFKLDPATVAVLTGLGAAPWVVKPLYGFISDTVPIFGYRRRSYLIICGILGAASWLAMSAVVSSSSFACAMLVVGSLGTACSDVVVDSIVVERCRGAPQALCWGIQMASRVLQSLGRGTASANIVPHMQFSEFSTAGSLQSLCWGSAAVGGIVSAYFSGSLVQAWGTRGVFACTAIFPLLVTLSAAFISEQPVAALGSKQGQGNSNGHPLKINPGTAEQMWMRFKVQAHALWAAVQQRSILYPAIFTFCWQATPAADTAFFYFETNQLGFTPEFMGRIRLAGSIASLIGVGIYNYSLKDVSLKKMFLWTALFGCALGMTQLILITGLNEQWGIRNEYFVLGDSVILTVLGQVSFMPVLVLAARSCPEGVEATLFATLMSILNGGAMTGSALGALLTKAFGITATDLHNLAALVFLCNLSSLLPLPLLRLLPEGSTREQMHDAEEQE